MEYYERVLNLSAQALAPKSGLDKLPRRERERLMRRVEIIEAGRHVFARKGYHDSTLDDVAEAAELGKATLYSYFDSKELLFTAVIEDSFATMLALGTMALAAPGTFDEKVGMFVAAEMDYFFRNPSSIRLMMSEAYQLRKRNPMLHLTPQLLRHLAGVIGDAQRDGHVLPDAEPMALAGMLLNLMYGRVMAPIHKTINAAMDPVTYVVDEVRFAELLKQLDAEPLEARVMRGTTLVLRVFLSGIRL